MVDIQIVLSVVGWACAVHVLIEGVFYLGDMVCCCLGFVVS